jgi:hypothetical protein
VLRAWFQTSTRRAYRLKRSDLDFNGNFIDVQRTLPRGKITTPKSWKTRRIDISKQLAAVLDELLSKRAATLHKEAGRQAQRHSDRDQ